MKPKKEPYISDKMQQVAVDILADLEIILMRSKELDTCEKIFDALCEVIKDNEDKYVLQRDPFTRLLCTSKEYAKLSYSYDKQKAEEMYGYSDWF